MKKGLRRILYPDRWLVFVLVILSIVFLIFALKDGEATSAFNLGTYLLSAYTLVIVCARIPKVIRFVREIVQDKAGSISAGNENLDRAMQILMNYEQRSRYLLYISLGFNLLYAVFKLGMGTYYRSFWLGALGIYYAVLAALRFSLARSINKEDERADRNAYRRTAWLLNLLTLVMSGVFVQMVIQNRSYAYPGILIYVMAIWAFAKIITAIVNLIKRRKDENKTLAASRCVSFAGALMSILALQTAMIAQFGEESVDFARLMNAIGGAVVTGLLITLSAFMIARSSEWDKTTEEETKDDPGVGSEGPEGDS